MTREKKNKYLEIELNPKGLYYLALVNNTEKGLDIEQIDVEIETKVGIKKYGWSAKVILELDLLKKLGINSEPFFAVYRQDFTIDKLNLYALNPTYAKTFHKIESFEKLPIRYKLY